MLNVTLILFILFLGAVATWLFGNKRAQNVALVTGIAAFIVAVVLVVESQNGANIGYVSRWIDNPMVYFSLGTDGLSLLMLLLTTALTPIIILSGAGSNYNNPRILYALILFMSFAMCGAFLATDGLLYYIFWELSLIPIYFIALLWGNGEAESLKKAVVKFFIYTIGGSLFMLTAFAYLYQKTGNFLISDLSTVPLTSEEQFWIFLGFFLAYAIKIPLIPFHTWQASVYEKAPTVGTMLLSGLMLKMGLYSIIRWQLQIAPTAAKQYGSYFIAIGIAGVLYGSIIALQQKNLKRLLAYSSLAHVGLIAAACYTLTADGIVGAVIQMLAHGFVVVGLFFAAEIIFRRLQTGEISNMGGLRAITPKFSSMFMLIVLASVALPGTFNFVGEFMSLYSLCKVNIWFAVFAGLTIILGAFYMLRMFQQVMLGETTTKLFPDVSVSEGTVLVLLLVGILFFGLYPKPLITLLQPTITEILTKINRFG